MDLVAIGLFESLDYQLALDGGNNFHFRLAPRPLEQLSRPVGDVTRAGFSHWDGYWPAGCSPLGLAANLGGQVRQKDGFTLGHNESASNDILQFTNVSRPVVLLQSLEGPLSNRARRGRLVLCELAQEV